MDKELSQRGMIAAAVNFESAGGLAHRRNRSASGGAELLWTRTWWTGTGPFELTFEVREVKLYRQEQQLQIMIRGRLVNEEE